MATAMAMAMVIPVLPKASHLPGLRFTPSIFFSSPLTIHKYRRCQLHIGNVGFRPIASLQVEQRGDLTKAGEDATIVREYLERISDAMGLVDLDQHELVTLSGRQNLLGMDGDWKFSWCIDGRFYESFHGNELTFEWGYDGKQRPWQIDFAGRVTKLDLDDLELCLLSSWIRTGYWLTEEGQNELVIHLGEPSKGPEQHFSVNLKGSRILAHVSVDTTTWLPLRMVIYVHAGQDLWEYSNWRILQTHRKCRFPLEIMHSPPPGGRNIISANATKLEHIDSDGGLLFSSPTSAIVPRPNESAFTAEVDSSIPPHLNMIQAESGHLLVRPLIDGQDIGYFILDTGSSGLTIDPKKAKDLGMHGFGDFSFTGVEGKVRSQFVRGMSFHLGRLKISNPLYVEVSTENIVKGVSPVAGLCGSDLFHHCVVEMSILDRKIALFDPLDYICRHQVQWQSIRMLENVPNLSAKLNGQDALLLLDTGAGGVDLILHGRAVKEYRLMKENQSFLAAKVRGVNGSDAGLEALCGKLASLEVGGHSFQNVQVLFFPGDAGCVDFSVYTAGLFCSQLLKDFILILDYPRCQFALVRRTD